MSAAFGLTKRHPQQRALQQPEQRQLADASSSFPSGPAPALTLYHAWLSIRPWSFPVTLGAVFTGAALAYVDAPQRFRFDDLAFALLCALSVHSAGNLANTYFDYKSGLDTKATADDRALVDGLVSADHAFRLCLAFFAVGLCTFAVFVYRIIAELGISAMAWSIESPVVYLFLLFLSGVLLAWCYTAWPIHLKYRGLGDICIILAYGPLLVSGAYFVLTLRPISATHMLYSIPVGLCTEAVLHVNNARDVIADRQAKALTLPQLLGETGTRVFFIMLYVGAYAAQAAFAWMPALHVAASSPSPLTARVQWSFTVLPLVTLPLCVGLIASFVRREWAGLCERTGQFSFLFALVHVICILCSGTSDVDASISRLVFGA